MNEKILDTIKKMISVNDDWFDVDILVLINNSISTLRQLGMSSNDLFIVTSDSLWSDYITNEKYFGDIQTYIYMRVKRVFDPPSSQALLEAMNQHIAEIEWRLINDK